MAGPDGMAGFEEVRGEEEPDGVAGGKVHGQGFPHILPNCLLDTGLGNPQQFATEFQELGAVARANSHHFRSSVASYDPRSIQPLGVGNLRSLNPEEAGAELGVV